MFALILPLMLSACDLGTHFSKPDSWTESAVDFAVEFQKDGFGFASQKRDIVNCMKRGACTWYGLEVWETRIYYGAEGATRVEMSLYNRGDDKTAGGLDSEGLKKLLDDIAAKAQPGGKIGANPEKKKLKTGGYQFSKKWNKGDCDIDLVWGVDSVKEKDLTADYVRVTMHPKGGAKEKASAKSGGIVSKTKAKAHVKKNADGDVWIDGVPMVDQGQKGYCAAATAERILRYFGLDVDQHQVAQLAETSARGGTSIEGITEAITSIGKSYSLDQKNLIATDKGKSFQDSQFFRDLKDYNAAARRAKKREINWQDHTEGNMVDITSIWNAMDPQILMQCRMRHNQEFTKFTANIRSYVDSGIPLFWSCLVGLYPEGPDVNSGGRAFGHIRLIVGYNTKTHEILYSDSWGPNHALKRMPETQAWAMTKGLLILKPRM